MEKQIDEIEQYKQSITEHRKNNLQVMFRGPYTCPMCKKHQLFSQKTKTEDGKIAFKFDCKNPRCKSKFTEVDAMGSIIDAYNRLIDRVG